MSRPHVSTLLSHVIAVACFLVVASLPAQAQMTQTLVQMAAPLAEQFGVPSASVTKLFEEGVSLESVTQLLLISQDSEKSLDDVSKVYRDSENDITKTADELKVAASKYSKENTTAAINEAKVKLEEDTKKAASDSATKAVDSAFGKLNQ